MSGFVTRAFGPAPRKLLAIALPTTLGVLFDGIVRHPHFTNVGRFILIYARGIAISLAFWAFAFSIVAKIPAGRARRFVVPLFVALVFPICFLTYVVQWRYFREADAFFQANTLTLAWRQRDSLATAAQGLGALWTLGACTAAALTAGAYQLAKKTAETLSPAAFHVPLAAAATLAVMLPFPGPWTGGFGVLPPDTSVLQAVAGAAVGGDRPLGMALRTPLVTPQLPRSETATPTVILIISESLRADSFPSSGVGNPLDAVIPARVPLTQLRTPAASTVIASLAIATGLPPTVNSTTALEAPLLFEVAKSAGYRTAYVGSQLGTFHSFSTFLRNAGIDERVFAEDLTNHPHPEYGAEDRLALERAFATLRDHPEPTFLVIHLSSTHYPYLVHDELAPHQPMSTVPDRAHKEGLWNRYRNSILLQERSLAAFYKSLQTLPRFAHTATLFLSDHGEQFFEHGAFSHTINLFEEELRIPGFVVVGPEGISAEQTGNLRAWSSRNTYSQDFHATILDLLGVWDVRDRIPLAARRVGRSLLRAPPPTQDGIAGEPIVLLSHQNGLWEDDNPAFGALQSGMKLQGRFQTPFACFDRTQDPGEAHPLPAAACPPELLAAARSAFPFVPRGD